MDRKLLLCFATFSLGSKQTLVTLICFALFRSYQLFPSRSSSTFYTFLFLVSSSVSVSDLRPTKKRNCTFSHALTNGHRKVQPSLSLSLSLSRFLLRILCKLTCKTKLASSLPLPYAHFCCRCCCCFQARRFLLSD